MARVNELAQKINELSLKVKLGLLAGVYIVLGAVYWYWFWTPKVEELESLELQIQKEERVLNEYRLIAKALPEFERQYNIILRQYEAASKKLPTDKEIPGLIDSIYGAVNEAGLESNTFTPQGEIKKDIYAEIPVQMEVFGSYFSIAKFFDRVARLPRIVNIYGLNLEKPKGSSEDGRLEASFTAVTFRVLPQPEVVSAGEKEKAKSRATDKKKRGGDEGN